MGAWGLRRLVLGVGVVLALLCAPARADAGDPYLRFWTLSTPHFRVHYHEGLESIAERAASIAERAHRLLVPHLAGAPDDITNIVLIDDSDSANGIASATSVWACSTKPRSGSTGPPTKTGASL